MKPRIHFSGKKAVQILIIASIAFVLNALVVMWSNDDSIWLDASVEVVGSIIFGPAVGGIATLLSTITTDFLTYHSLEFSFVSIFEAASIFLIGLIYRTLIKDEDKFGVREIVVFNFVQVLVNMCILYLSTPPAAVVLFDFIVEDWTREEMWFQMGALGSNAFSACISEALIGTVLLALCTAIRKQYKKHGSLSAALHHFSALSFIKKEYRSRAVEYTVGIFFAVALTMVDGVVSGQVLGIDALAATSLMLPLVSFSTFVSNIITTGCSNLCAIAKGDGDYGRARKLFTMGLLSNIGLGIAQSVLFYCTQNAYFEFYTTTPAIAKFAREYYSFFVFVPPFMAMATFLDEMVSSDGDDMLSYAGYLTSFGINVGVSIALAKTLGMKGLAIGTLLSYIGYILVVSIHFLKKSNTYKLHPYFSFKDLFEFVKRSLKTNTTGLCTSAVSATFTKAILLFWGNEYLIANTVLCAMLEIYEMVNGPSEAAEYLFATYSGEKNREGIKTLFREALSACIFAGMIISVFLLLAPRTVLMLYGIEKSPFYADLIKCIRYCAVGVIAASVGGFLSDYYGDIEKPFWSCIMAVFRIAVFPILFCVTFSLVGGIIAMGIGMLLAQIFAVAVFFGFVLIVKGPESIPYMLDDPDFEKVHMFSFTFNAEDYGRTAEWIEQNLTERGIEKNRIDEISGILLSLFEKTEKKNGNRRVLGECVLRFIGEPKIVIKDNGELFAPDIEGDGLTYNVLMSCNSNTIRI